MLWILETGKSGFPLKADKASGISVLREHHRQVMHSAVATLWKYARATIEQTTARLHDRPGSLVSIIGTPGVGQSRALVFLMWFLLQEGSSFLLEAGPNERRRFILVRPISKTVSFLTLEEATFLVGFDQCITTLVDPQHFQKDEDVTFSPMLNAAGVVGLIAQPPDSRHMPRSDKNSMFHEKFYVSSYPLRLLRIVSGLFVPAAEKPLTENELVERFEVVGGVPRAIFDLQTFKEWQGTIKKDSKLAGKLADRFLHAILSKNNDMMQEKPVKEFLTFSSTHPFTEEYTQVGFLSATGMKQVGNAVYKKIRTMPLNDQNDPPSLGFFFEQWVGLILSSGQDNLQGMGFELVHYSKKEPIKTPISWPKKESWTPYADEDFMIKSVLVSFQSIESGERLKIFPPLGVSHPPAGTPVYDYMIGPKCVVNATIASSHSIKKASCAKLVNRVGATPAEPLHLFFFVKDEEQAATYGNRGGESFDGDVVELNIAAECVARLKKIVAEATEEDMMTALNRIAEELEVPTAVQVDSVVRKRNPTQLLEAVLSSLRAVKQGNKDLKWERIKATISQLPEDPAASIFDEKAVVQHTIALARVED